MAEAIKSDILSSLREGISKIIKEELKRAFADDFNSLKSELQAVRLEISSSTATIRSEVDRMKADLTDMAGGLSTWSDEVASLQTAVTCLQSQVEKLKEKNEDLEGRMRRGNIRIVGVDEQPESSSPAAVSRLLKEALRMDRDVKVDRSHRCLIQWKPGDRPRVIIAKLHYDGDAAEILRRARDRAPLSYNGKRISIYPDYTATKARASFTSVRKMLRGLQGVRYGLLYPARLRISYKNEEKEFLDVTKTLLHYRNRPNNTINDELRETLRGFGLLRQPDPQTAASPEAGSRKRGHRKRCARPQKRGKRAGVRTRPTSKPARAALPSILLSNICSLENKLTPIIMKCFERLVMRHIKTLLPPSLDPLQFAYRPNRSTDDAISTTLHLALTHLDNIMFECCS
ncbi:hypothetical protein NFI96_008255 [Prochilodus magdalenae]|nr:hypothetical protein NFI96_008255 [Prochilodus magdalenae]